MAAASCPWLCAIPVHCVCDTYPWPHEHQRLPTVATPSCVPAC